MRRLLVLLMGLMCLAAAPDPAERLPDAAQEERARELFREIRCVVCQNETIDDSEADLASDLRAVVREQVAAGRSEDEIKAYLTERYGRFILFRPPFSSETVVLWLAPLIVLLAGAFVVVVMLRSRPQTVDEPLAEEEAARLRQVTGGAAIRPHQRPENSPTGERNVT